MLFHPWFPPRGLGSPLGLSQSPHYQAGDALVREVQPLGVHRLGDAGWSDRCRLQLEYGCSVRAPGGIPRCSASPQHPDAARTVDEVEKKHYFAGAGAGDERTSRWDNPPREARRTILFAVVIK